MVGTLVPKTGTAQEYLQKCSEAIRNIDEEVIAQIVDVLADMWGVGGKVILCGNGGSAATATHLATDLTKCINCLLPEKAFPFRAMPLTNSAPLVTCIGNDVDFSQVFSIQLRHWWNLNDVLWVISGSGNSPNVLAAIEAARDLRAKRIIGFSGYDGGKLAGAVDLHLHIPVDDMQIVEDAHMAAGHLVFRELSKRLVQLSRFE